LIHRGHDIARQRFERIAPEYDLTIGARRKVYNDALTAITISIARAIDAERVLDAGCGTGQRAIELMTALPKARIEAMDFSDAMLDIAINRGVLQAVSSNLGDFSVTNTYDMIVCLFFVIGYLTPRLIRAQAMNCLFRALRPGGVLVIDGINRFHRGEGRLFRRTRLEIVRDLVTSWLDPRCEFGDKFYRTHHSFGELRGFHHSFSRPEFEDLIAKAGFVIRRSLVVGYDTGEEHDEIHKGQLVIICERPSNEPVSVPTPVRDELVPQGVQTSTVLEVKSGFGQHQRGTAGE
jgi:SAM-dependent methyltransferase